VEHGADPLDPKELFGHVQDAEYFHFPGGAHVHVPQIRESREPIFEVNTGFKPLDDIFLPFDLRITKFMVLEVVAALLLCIFFVALASRIRRGARPRGAWWNFLEVMVVFFRDQVARPAIGKQDADRFLPFILTIFFFVLICNLLGMVPWMGSPTGSLAVTGALAMCTFIAVCGAGMARLGPVGFWKAQVPHMDLPGPLAFLLVPMIFLIEILGLLIKHFVLAVRLLANMMAGHVVLAVILAFIAAAAGSIAWYGVMPACWNCSWRFCRPISSHSCPPCLSAWRFTPISSEISTYFEPELRRHEREQVGKDFGIGRSGVGRRIACECSGPRTRSRGAIGD